ncbi:TetR/AcrR family transcriptional regulator [Azotosporobacter soli]|uniref:TetR/AcrR family transcriptional regulator n=1 Tax=Azotosporobacter soli TaxID=3055040 RepID=UPI0031FEA961
MTALAVNDSIGTGSTKIVPGFFFYLGRCCLIKTRIINAALSEMHLQGLKFTMSDLARRLGVSKRTLYESFSSKDAIISEILHLVLNDLRMQRQRVMNDDSLSLIDKIKTILTLQQTLFPSLGQEDARIAIDIKRHMPELWQEKENCFDDMWRLVEELLAAGMASGYFRPLNLPALRKILKGALAEMFDYDFLLLHKLNLPDMISYVTDVILFGIVADQKQDCPR